jgi:hypothetical protein
MTGRFAAWRSAVTLSTIECVASALPAAPGAEHRALWTDHVIRVTHGQPAGARASRFFGMLTQAE